MSQESKLLLPYQLQYAKDDLKAGQKSFIVVEKARRTGFTFAEACWSVKRRLFIKEDHWFASADEKTSKEFISYCKQWAQIFNIQLGENAIDLSRATTEYLEMPNGSKIVAVSSNPRALRGKGGSVTLDEFAHHDDQEEAFKAAQAVNFWGGSLRIISTHNGPATIFNKIVKEAEQGKNGFRHFRVTLEDAVRQGLALKLEGPHKDRLPDVGACNRAFIDMVKATCLNDEAFGQEYMCVPAKLSALVTAEQYDRLVLEVDKKDGIPTELSDKPYGPLMVGIDIGRTKDLTVVWVVEQGEDPTAKQEYLRDVYRTVCILAMKNTEFPIQFQRITQILNHPSIHQCVIDMGGPGRQISDDLVNEYGSTVHPYSINAGRKAQLCEQVKKFIQYELVSLPPDQDVKEDVCSMARVATLKGNLSYEGGTGKTHADYFMALALAIQASQMSNGVSLTTSSDNEQEINAN